MFRASRSGINIGAVFIRLSRRNLAKWGFEAVRVGGYSFWSRTNGGDRVVASYHPRWSTTWVWSATIRKSPLFARKAIDIDRELYEAGNPYAEKPSWRRHFVRLTSLHQGQWHDDYRLPFGRVLTIGSQDYHLRQKVADERSAKLRALFFKDDKA